MCDLSRPSAREKVGGFKIAARKPNGKRYFSISMGFKYPLDGHIPIAKKQNQIYTDFVTNIISKSNIAYRDHMVGRTTIFLYFHDAQNQYCYWKNRVREGYILVIVQSEVSVDVMLGSYGPHEVAAGRHIRFIGEWDCLTNLIN